jgi:hypothetical protein
MLTSAYKLVYRTKSACTIPSLCSWNKSRSTAKWHSTSSKDHAITAPQYRARRDSGPFDTYYHAHTKRWHLVEYLSKFPSIKPPVRELHGASQLG